MNDMQFLVLAGFTLSAFINLVWLFLSFVLRTPRGYRGSVVKVFFVSTAEALFSFIVVGLVISGILWVGYVITYR